MSIQYSDNATMLDAVASTTTSQIYDVSKRQLVSIQFTATTYSSGAGTFSISASNDGTNWVNNIAFLDATATATGTSVTQKAVNATATPAIAIVNPSFRYLTVTCSVAGTGTYSATLEAKG